MPGATGGARGTGPEAGAAPPVLAPPSSPSRLEPKRGPEGNIPMLTPTPIRPAPAARARGHDPLFPRVASDVRVDLYARGSSRRLPARARALGVTGVCVETPSVFALASVHRVVVTLPDGRLSLDAAGRWQHEAGPDLGILSGIEFVDPPAEAVEQLWQVVTEGGRALAGFLARSELRGLDVEESIALAQLTRTREVRAGRTLYRHDAVRPGEDSVFLVRSGCVALQFRARGAREVTLETLGPGCAFGGWSLLGPLPPAESALVARDAELLEIDRAAFEHLRRTRPWLAERLGAALLGAHAARLRRLLARVGDRL